LHAYMLAVRCSQPPSYQLERQLAAVSRRDVGTRRPFHPSQRRRQHPYPRCRLSRRRLHPAPRHGRRLGARAASTAGTVERTGRSRPVVCLDQTQSAAPPRCGIHIGLCPAAPGSAFGRINKHVAVLCARDSSAEKHEKNDQSPCILRNLIRFQLSSLPKSISLNQHWNSRSVPPPPEDIRMDQRKILQRCDPTCSTPIRTIVRLRGSSGDANQEAPGGEIIRLHQCFKSTSDLSRIAANAG